MKVIEIKEKKFGDENPLICIPIISDTLDAFITDFEICMSHSPDVVEWRADYFEALQESQLLNAIFDVFKPYNHSVAIIFTLRSHDEGGKKVYSEAQRLEIIKKVLAYNMIDFVDVEINSSLEFVESIKALCDQNLCKLILSHHDYTSTPPESEIHSQMDKAVKLGADLIKIAYLAENASDVLTVFNSTMYAKETLEMPIIGVSMGELGAVSRIFGGQFGSVLTYASSSGKSAPGQLPVELIRKIWSII